MDPIAETARRQRENDSMINTSEDKSRGRAAKDTDARTKRRAAQAQIVAGLQSILEADEQLLGFTRGIIAGGLRGKLTVGFEALFAPYVNIGLTERRVVLQHVQPESGKPNEILPHSFPLSEMSSIVFSDIETFGGEPAGRLNLRLFNDQHFRLRFRDADYVDNAKTIADVFTSLTATRPKARTSPTQSVCPHCDQVLDRTSRFCPYCGHGLDSMPPTTGERTAKTEMAADLVPIGTSATIPAAEAPAANEPMTAASADSVLDSADKADASIAAPAASGSLDATSPPDNWTTDTTLEADKAIEEPALDLPTEGHEALDPGGDPRPSKIEGDRSL